MSETTKRKTATRVGVRAKKDSTIPTSTPDSGDTGAMATVMHGPYAEQLPVAGQTVRAIRDNFADRFDIAPDAVAYIEGEPVDENATVDENEVLMFARRAGEKG